MGQAEELLNSLAGTTTYVGADHVTIGKDRYMVVPDNLKKLGVSPDHGVNTIHIVGPRYSENGSDLSKMSIWVNFMRSDDYPDACKCTNVEVDADDETLLHYDWEISRNVTEVHGNLTVLVCAKEVDAAGFEKDHWNSELNRDFYVSEGLEVQESVISQYPDLVEHMLLRVATVENKTTKAYVLNCVKEYLSEDPSVIIEHIEKVIAEQPIQEFVNEYLDDYVDIGTMDSRTLVGSVAGAYEMVSMEGASKQAQYEGKNLYNKAASTDGYGVGNSGDVYVDDTASASDYIEIESSASYSHTNVEWAQWYDENKNYIGIGTGKIMTAPSNAKYARLTVRIVNKDSAQFELGEVTSPYEPYCGGKPSPSPEYPQEIKSVAPEATVRTHGENILGGLRFANMLIESGVRATINKSDKTVEVVADANTKKFSYSNFKEKTQYTFFIKGYNRDSNYVQVTNLRIVYTDGTDGFLSFAADESQTVIVSAAGKTVAQLVGIFAASSSVIYYEDFGIMEGIRTLEDFKPYQESSAKITLSEPLRGVGDARDIIEKRNGKWGVLRKIKSVVFDGSADEGWKTGSCQDGTRRLVTDSLAASIKANHSTTTKPNILCDCFTKATPDEIYLMTEGMTVSNTSLIAYSKIYNTTDVSAWTNHLQSNPITVFYELAVPVWEELPAKYQTVLDELATFEGTTHVIIEGTDIQPIVTSKYGTSEVGARAITNTNRIEKLEEPIVESDSYELVGSAPGGYRLLEMLGNTEQKKLSGKNKFNLKNITYTDKGITFTTHGNGRFSASGTATENVSINLCEADSVAILREYIASGKELIMSLDGAKYDSTVCNISLLYNRTDGSLRYMIPNTTSTVFESGATFNNVNIYIASGTAVNLNNIGIQIEEGSKVTTWEEFCGGVPSPNPQFPQAMKSTGECVELIQGAYVSGGTYSPGNKYVCSKNKMPCSSGDIISIKHGQESAQVVYYSNGTYLSYANLVDSITVPSGATHFTFNIHNSNGLTPDTVGKITLTINGKYVNQIVRRNKNFIIPIVRTTTSKGINFDVNKNGAVYINGTSVDYADCYIMDKVLPSGNYIFTQDNPNITSYVKCNGKYYGFDKEPLPFTSDGINSVAVFIRVPSGTTINTEVSVMCREASVVDDTFEVGKEIITTFLADEPPRLGDVVYKDNDGLWKLEHNTHETRLLSEWGWSLRANGTIGSNGICDFQATSNDKGYASACQSEYTTAEAMCTHYPIASFYQVYVNNAPNENSLGVYSDVNGEYAKFRCRNTNVTTLEQLKTWLTENEVIVQYKLATPIIEVLDTQSQIALNGLETFAGVTYLEFDSRTKPSGINGEYGTTKSAGYTLKALNNSESYLASVLVSEAANVTEPAATVEPETTE